MDALTAEIAKIRREKSRADALQDALRDLRPKIALPTDNRLLSDFAAELGEILRDQDVFIRNGEIVALADGELRPLNPQTFRTLVEKFCVCYLSRGFQKQTFEVGATMRDDTSRGVLASPQFAEKLRRVRRVNRARLPIFDAEGKISLLPVGYHAPTQTLTLADVDFDLEMPPAVAVETLNDLLCEFSFADGARSKSVAVAAMLGLFANQLLPEKSLRPCFIFVANAEGAGKTLLAQICIVPTLGMMPTGHRPDDDDEIAKILLTAVREARPVLFFDNMKGRLSSAALEGFLSAPQWTGRKLGANESIVADNLATVFITGNGLTVSPDMRRRSLFVELHLEAERAEDRQFKRELDLPTLLEMRPKILAALWAFVRQWDLQGRPEPSRGHSAFPSWAKIIGGIVESAGFGCPLETANIAATVDPDGEDMRRLVAAMAERGEALAFAELVELARELGCFETIIGDEGELKHAERIRFGKMLQRYDNRLVLSYRFRLEGKGHARKYYVERVGNAQSQSAQSVSPQIGNRPYTRNEGKHCADYADYAEPVPANASELLPA